MGCIPLRHLGVPEAMMVSMRGSSPKARRAGEAVGGGGQKRNGGGGGGGSEGEAYQTTQKKYFLAPPCSFLFALPCYLTF
jgi:hypothetical protein